MISGKDGPLVIQKVCSPLKYSGDCLSGALLSDTNNDADSLDANIDKTPFSSMSVLIKVS